MFNTPSLTAESITLPFSADRRTELRRRLRDRYDGPLPAQSIRDRRLRALALTIEKAPDDWKSVQNGIRQTGLSCAYLSVRFKQEARLPMRSYALWLKFEHACLLSMAGVMAREAALEAGFADQSHLGRAARRFAGKSFGQVQKDLKALSDEEVGASTPKLTASGAITSPFLHLKAAC